MNFLDRTISYINPRWGYERMKFRSYEAAATGRRAKSFNKARNTGVNLEISQALTTVRSRSRWFVRNNGWAKEALREIRNHTVGEGIRPAPVGTKNQIKKAKNLWKTWAESTSCDWNEKNTFYGLQGLIMHEIAEGGEVLVVKRRVKPTPNNPIPIKLQVIECDHLDNSRDGQEKDGYTRMGVKFDNEGRVMGYWVYDTHPTDGTVYNMKITSTYIPKSECLHVFEILRLGQIRGVPMGIASFLKLSDFSDYEDAQLVRQKVAACYTAFVSGDDNTNDLATERLEPGLIQYLKQGETVTFGNPPPAEGYDSYTKKILQGIASSYGITYEMLTKDYSNVNFSSGRMAKIDVTHTFRSWQYNMIVPQLCVPVWDWFMEAAIIAGLTTVRVTCSATDWTAPRVQQLDPTKETAARISAIQGGLTTISECLREDGRDPEEFFEEYRRDMDKLKELGISLSSIILPQIKEENNQNDGKTEE